MSDYLLGFAQFKSISAIVRGSCNFRRYL